MTSIPRVPDQDGELSGNQTVVELGGARRNLVSTVGVAPYLSEGYSFAVFDQIRDLDHDALRRLTAEPGLDF